PFPNSGRIVAIVAARPSQNQSLQTVSVQDFAILAQRQTSFEVLGEYGDGPVNLSTEDGRPERFQGARLTVAAFNALGVEPELGRGFHEGDDRPGAPMIVLLGHDLWRDRYGSDRGIVGRTIRVNGAVHMVIGVMPQNFGFPILQQLWTPL